MQPVRGTFDLLDIPLKRHKAIEKIALEKAALYGYREIVTPIFEYTSVFTKPLGETSDIVGKEMYTFQDRGGESITLRPEGTAPVLRAILSEGLTQTLPQRRVTSGPFFRYERPQKGRFRQFHQISAECIGIASFHADVEIISLAYDILSSLGLSSVTLHLNTLGDMESRIAYREALISFFKKYETDLSEDSQARLYKNPLRILDSKAEQDKKIIKEAPSMQQYLSKESQKFFEDLCNALSSLDIEFVLDPSLVRGMDYYCHTVFEFKSSALGAQDTVLGGGRYDGLMEQMGGPKIPAVGFGAGIERLSLIANNLAISSPNPRICFIPLGEEEALHTVMLLQRLRNQGIYAEMLLSGKIQKRLSQAVKNQAEYACIIGTDEISSKSYKLRHLLSCEESHNKEIVLTLEEMYVKFK